ncbi:MAG: ferritin family protein [Geobacter sp.]|nr:ferritin family protein [Geobacter sp.]
MNDSDIREAVRRSLQTERSAMQFYQLGAGQMKDAEARRVFTVLAGEERGHAEMFYKIYTGTDIPSFAAFMDTEPDNRAGWLAALDKLLGQGVNEQKALELAMSNEQNLEKSLLETAARIKEPAVREIFELNARETHNHYLMIEAEYARIMKMVDESDMDTFVRE